MTFQPAGFPEIKAAPETSATGPRFAQQPAAGPGASSSPPPRTRSTYGELRGAELRGAAEIVGEVPRTGTPDARLAEPERLYARKYEGTDVMHHTGHREFAGMLLGSVSEHLITHCHCPVVVIRGTPRA